MHATCAPEPTSSRRTRGGRRHSHGRSRRARRRLWLARQGSARGRARSLGQGRVRTRRPPAVAFSVWAEAATPGYLPKLAETLKLLELDLVLVETGETIPEDLSFPEYELLLETGLPLWVSYRWTVDGPPDLTSIVIPPARGELQEADGELLGLAGTSRR